MGIYIAQLSGAAGQIQDIFFSNGKIQNSGWDGVRIDPGAGQSCTGVSLSDLTIRSAGKRGISLRGANNINISDLQLYDTADGWQSLYLESCSGVAIANGNVDYVNGSKSNKLDCVHINETSVSSIQGMTLVNGGTGIRLLGSNSGSNRNIIDGNKITDCRVGVSIATALCSGNIVRNNQLLRDAIPLNDSGTGTVKENNVTV
jgi:parallel beta-helix repeat protein